jgi:hypothetical protein
MRTAIFDIETNGLLHQLDRVHSLVVKIIETGEVYSCCHPFPGSDQSNYCDIEWGLLQLQKADRVVGHNIIKFDLPAIQKVYPDFNIPVEKIHDTLLYSRLLWPELGDKDMGLIRSGKMPGKLRGSHGLEAWGHRLKLHKGDYAKEMKAQGLDPWAEWNLPMQDYCELDVEVTEKLWEKINTKELPERAVQLEHWFCYIIGLQERFGYRFNVKSAVELYSKLAARRAVIDEELKQLFQPWYVNAGLTKPKRDNSRFGYVEGAPFCKVKLQEFNPSSRQQIADRLIKLFNWKPQEFTESGQPKVDETTLSTLDNRPAKLLSERFLVEKRIGQLAEGDQAWLKLERNGRIHGSVNTIGAVTGRCTHSQPNVAQVPGVRAEYGQECRELFCVDEGYKQVGADASGLELRCLAHYMAKYDGGAYGKVILEGDIHTENQKAAGLPTRDNAKTFIYAFLYGAGDEKIGQIIGKGSKAGKKLKENFLNRTPALKRLREDVAAAVKKRGYLRGIDGRRLHIRSEHAALNTLLQSAGALLVKQATVNLYLELSTRGYIFGKDWAMVAHVHDEYQLQVREDLVDEVMEVAVWSFQEAGRQFNWRCPLDGEAKVGNNWSECH